MATDCIFIKFSTLLLFPPKIKATCRYMYNSMTMRHIFYDKHFNNQKIIPQAVLGLVLLQ